MSQLVLSLTDVAALAGVARPVPTTWRSRHRHTAHPFPAAATSVAGEDRFDVESVVRWLEATGLGNNPTAREDAAAHALPAGVDPRTDPSVFDSLSALLCLRAVSGADLAPLGPDGVQVLAAQVDPADHLLRREVDAAADRPDELAALASLADRRADAAWSSAAAFEQVLLQQARHGSPAAAGSPLAPTLHHLVGRVAVALARQAGTGTLVEPTGRGNDLVVPFLLAEAEAASEVDLLSPDVVGPTARRFRRRLRVHGLHRSAAPADPGELSTVGPSVVLLRLPDGEVSSPAEVLDVIDRLALGLGGDQRALVVAPAAILTDALRDTTLDSRRSQTLRTGRVRAMIRLPRGLVTSQPRQALAVWVLGPGDGEARADQRRLAVADLSESALSPEVVGLLVDDVAAMTLGPDPARIHTFGCARLMGTATLLAADGALVTPSVAAGGVRADASAVEVERLRADRRPRCDALGGARLEPGSPRPGRPTTTGRAIADGALRLVAGHRSGFDTVAAGNVAVIGVPELLGDARPGSRTVDRLAFLGSWPANRLTEPGDVVFCTSPRPAAVVDADGGSAVQAPARVLRVHPVRGEGLSPHVLAHVIDHQADTAREWRSWSVPWVPAAQLTGLADALDSIRREHDTVRARASELDDLAAHLIDAVTTGVLGIVSNHPSDPHDQQES